MNLRAVGWLLGSLILLLAGVLLVPAAVGFAFGERKEAWSCIASAAIAAAVGGGLVWSNRGSALTPEGRLDYFRREGLAVAGLTWFVVGLAGALFFLLSGAMDSLVDAFFESASGFTTTGATILSAEAIDRLPHALSFWRALSHWVGGIGIVVVFVVIFPTGGRSLYRSEVSGVTREASLQRVRDSALALMRVYVLLTAVHLVLLWLAGLSWFDATVHAFSTLATGGFSNRGASISYYGSWVVELILIVFMVAAGINFALWDSFLRIGPRRAWRAAWESNEVRLYGGLLVGATLAMTLVLWAWGGSRGVEASGLPDYTSFPRALRDAAFNLVSIQTCTGYATADYDRWPDACRLLLVVAMFVGACAGSTGGGIKVVRLLIVAKAAFAGILRFVRPRAIHDVRVDQRSLDDRFVASATRYFVLWVLAAVAGSIAISLMGSDLVTSVTGVVACLNNCGPGLARVGPVLDYGAMSDGAKLLLAFLMIVGRLEFYAVAALFVPGFWRR